MSSNIQQPSQGASPSDLQPRRAYKPAKSRKAPAIQAAILAKRAIGTSKRQIAKEMQVSPNTVTSIIELSDFDAKLTDGRTLCAELIPASVRVVKHRLAQNSENAAFKLLEGIGVLGKDAKPVRAPDTSLMVNIQQLMGNVQVNAQPATPNTSIVKELEQRATDAKEECCKQMDNILASTESTSSDSGQSYNPPNKT